MQVNTVLGPIDSADLGQTLIHEHITTADWSMRANFGQRFFDEALVEETAVKMYGKLARETQIRTVCEGSAINLGRDVKLIKRVAEATGLNFIVSSGFYFQDDPFIHFASVRGDRVYEMLRADCVDGVADTGILPGMLKAALGEPGLTRVMRVILEAEARISAELGLPIFVHTEAMPQRNGLLALDVLIANGARPEKIVIGHSGDTTVLPYLEALLEKGCYLGMDRFANINKTPDGLQWRTAIVVELAQRGWAKQLLLSHDMAAYTGYTESLQNLREPGFIENRKVDFTLVSNTAVPLMLEMGLAQEAVDDMLVHNVRRLFE